jgi:Arc/MetJ family transcription regulator
MKINTHRFGAQPMRTNIVIDDRLIAEAMRLSGARTKRQAVEESLRLMVKLKRQEQVREAHGKLKWTGDLEAMRRD